MKKISILLALITFLFAELALAGAVVTSLTGTAQVQRGAGAPQSLRVGDEVNQGDTVSTGARSSLVLKFDDGEVTGLSSSSRMTVTAYQYDAPAKKGNILLSLIDGGMRAITGLIGKSRPEAVSYRVANVTIGIRGTIVRMGVHAPDLFGIVEEGRVQVQFPSRPPVDLSAQEGFFLHATDLKFGPLRGLGTLPSPLQSINSDLDGLTGPMGRSNPGEPRSGTPGEGTGTPSGTGPTGPTGPTGGGAGGGTGRPPSPS